MTFFDQLIDYYGTQKAAGDALGAFGEDQKVGQSSVAEWKVNGVPPPRQAQYEILTRGTKGALKADRTEKAAA